MQQMFYTIQYMMWRHKRIYKEHRAARIANRFREFKILHHCFSNVVHLSQKPHFLFGHIWKVQISCKQILKSIIYSYLLVYESQQILTEMLLKR